MSSLLQKEEVYFFQSKRPRINNPTYNSSGISDSLVSLNPQTDYTKNILKQTEYKQSFQPNFSRVQSLSYIRPSIYAKYSKAAYQKNRSLLSNYGATIVREGSKANLGPYEHMPNK